jgi:hypothetical protein
MVAPWQPKYVAYLYRKLNNLSWHEYGSELYIWLYLHILIRNVLMHNNDVFRKSY